MDNPNCEQVQSEVVIEMKQPDPVLTALQHPLFLVICILISAGCGLGIFSGNFSVIHVLLTIFSWLAYAKGRNGVADAGHLRCISGTVFASYVIQFILFGLIALCGILVAGLLLILGTNVSWLQWGLEQIDPELVPDIYDASGQIALTVFAFIIAGIFLFIAAFGIIINILGYRKFHKFAQSVYLSVGAEKPVFYKPKTVQGWAIAFGVVYGLSALSALPDFQLFAFLSNASFSAVFIVSSFWINKNFSNKD